MSSSKFKFQFTYLNSVESTNIYAFELLQKQNVLEGTVIYTNYQENGRGLHQKRWFSEGGKNLLMSIILKPDLLIEEQFSISQMIAIAVKNALVKLSVTNVKIKWPNDILVNDKKIAGILIRNSIVGNRISNAIIGLGLNINQTKFRTFERLPNSLKLELKKDFVIEKVRDLILNELKGLYVKLKEGYNFKEDYLADLYGFGEPKSYKDAEGKFIGVILGVLPDGRLQLNKNGKLKTYKLKQLQFIN